MSSDMSSKTPSPSMSRTSHEDSTTAAPSTPSLAPTIIILDEHTSRNRTAYAWSSKRKWCLLTVVAFCQISMNLNASVYSNAVPLLNDYFGITHARMGMTAFLVAYAFGCEFWAPFSEEFGRWPVMQASLGLTNISILICAMSNSFAGIIGGRIMGGLSSAGGSVTMGMVADMFNKDEQQHAVLWCSLFSCLGSVIGGIIGGPLEQFLHWRWNFWIQLILGVITQLLHGVIAKETRAPIMLDWAAKKDRKSGNANIRGPNDDKKWRDRLHYKEVAITMFRPYQLLLTEPIVLFLSLLSGLADALIFSFFESFGYVFQQWSFTPTQISLAFVALAVAYIIGYFTFFPIIARHNAQHDRGEQLTPEARLKPLLYLVTLLPTGLLICAFVATGPPIHWFGVIMATLLIGIANFAIYYTTIDYMVAAYGPHSASATGGNGFMRDLLAGLCALYTKPMYNNLGIRNSYLVLFGLTALFCVPVYVFYFKGPAIRAKSKFASQLARESEARGAPEMTESSTLGLRVFREV
jgi:MFS family permease